MARSRVITSCFTDRSETIPGLADMASVLDALSQNEMHPEEAFGDTQTSGLPPQSDHQSKSTPKSEQDKKTEKDPGHTELSDDEQMGTHSSDFFDLFSKEPDDKKEPAKFSKPSFFTMKPEETQRYTSIIRYLRKSLNKLTMEIAFITELVCLDAHQDLSFTLNSNREDDWKKLCKSPEVLLEQIWAKATNHPMFCAAKVSEADSSLNYFRYNAGQKRSSKAPFTAISRDEVVAYVRQWLTNLFHSNCPGVFGTNTFLNTLVNQLTANSFTVNSSSFMLIYPSGIAAGNGYYFCDHVSPLLRYVPYGPEIIVLSILSTVPNILTVMPEDRKAILEAASTDVYPTLPADWHNPGSLKLEDRVRDSSISYEQYILDPDKKRQLEMEGDQISEYWETAPFLPYIYNLCNHDILTLLLFRSLCQRTIMSPTEGIDYQSAFWIWGPPGTGKSSWAILLSLLVGSHLITEMSMNSNNFSNSALVGKRLVVLSDVVEIPYKMYKDLKPLLGRDFERIEIKNEKRVLTVRLPNQLLITGNKNPTACGKIMLDPAVLDKICIILLNHTLDAVDMGGDLSRPVSDMVADIFPWAILMNREWLNEQTRARKVNNTRKNVSVLVRDVFQDFIEDHLVYSINTASPVVPNSRTAPDGTPEPVQAKPPAHKSGSHAVSLPRPPKDSPEFLVWKELQRAAKLAQRIADLQCNAYTSKAAVRDAFEVWIKGSGNSDHLSLVGGSLSDKGWMDDLPNVIARRVFTDYGVVNYDKKKLLVNGYEGFQLIPTSMGKDRIGKNDNAEFRRFDPPRLPAAFECLQADWSDAMSGCYPFTPRVQTLVSLAETQHSIIKKAGMESAFKAAKDARKRKSDRNSPISQTPPEVKEESLVDLRFVEASLTPSISQPTTLVNPLVNPLVEQPIKELVVPKTASVPKTVSVPFIPIPETVVTKVKPKTKKAQDEEDKARLRKEGLESNPYLLLPARTFKSATALENEDLRSKILLTLQ